ncbi:TetR/AcrR family transcriptional regulator [Actinomadura sp. DC4]|uniref:TetR/AcrR family transcriptional regulator n=1 Tax=Actinomadura sp. DC4 TaxID=3055069 RepID=UPI0025B24F04|nr:TetR/AcrR family transcriptional regulator [Actinomadura sp. DC4]MDN3357414.1 TetR/AcrR family transcriptional regulator [Actinomadura sp. DC4]
MARPRSFDEQAVLDSAMRQFRAAGYAGTTLDDLSAATGLGRGSLYASFGGKHALFMRALGEYARQILDEVRGMLDGPDETAVRRLRDFIAAGARFVIDDADRLGCMAGKCAYEVGDQDEEAREIIRKVFVDQQRLIRDCVTAAQRYGDLDPDADPGPIAYLVLSLSRGFDVMAKGGIGATDLDATAERAFQGLPLTSRYEARRA